VSFGYICFVWNGAGTEGDHSNTEYYSFESYAVGLKIHQLWDYIRKHKANTFTDLEKEFSVCLSYILVSYG